MPNEDSADFARRKFFELLAKSRLFNSGVSAQSSTVEPCVQRLAD